jgi:hypothetical protein
MNGGIGAVSPGVAEALIEAIVGMLLIAAVLASLLGLWKLWKFLAAFFG